MGWRLHTPGVDPVLDEIIARRFGPGFEKPCRKPGVIECAMPDCQWPNACAYQPTDDEKYEQAVAKQRSKRKRV